MALDRRRAMQGIGAALAAPFVLGRPAQAAEVTLRLHHSLPASDSLHSAFLIAWAAGLREASDGRLEVRLRAAPRLGGSRELPAQVRDGRAEMAWVAVPEAAGQFPRLEALHLPFVAARASLVNSQVAQEFADRHPEEFPDVQPLIVAAGDHGVIHAVRQLAALPELRGARLRPPTPLAGEALQALGATAVTITDQLLAEAFTQQILDGGIAPWGSAPTELQQAAYHTEIAGSPTFGTVTFVLLINKARLASIPEGLRGLLIERSGLAGARLAGESFDKASAEALAAAQARGSTILQLPPDEKLRWIEATKPVIAAWVERARSRGIDGNAVLAELTALLAKYEPPAPPPAQVAAPAAPAELRPGSFTPPAAAPAVSAQPLAVPNAASPAAPLQPPVAP